MATRSSLPRSAPPIAPPLALARVSRRLGPRGPATAWTPPPLPDLIARIDLALAERRQG